MVIRGQIDLPLLAVIPCARRREAAGFGKRVKVFVWNDGCHGGSKRRARSCQASFVHLRKPDREIFRLALDIAQVSANQVLYIENTLMFVQVAEGLGIRSILHTDYKSTREKLASFGLPDGG